MNHSFRANTTVALALGASLLLAACGGGGGTTESSPAGISINAANSQDVGARAYSTTAGLNSQVGNSSNMVAGVSVTTTSQGLIDLSLQQLYRALQARPSTALVSGVTGSETVACTDGGSATVSYSVASTTQLSAGDRLSITTSNCQEGTTKINGGLSMTFNSISGMPGTTSAWSASISATFNAFSGTTGADSFSASGDMNMMITQSNAQDQSISATGNSLTVGATINGSTGEATLNNYSYAGTTKFGMTTFSANYSLTGNLPKLGNVAFAVKTTTEFKKLASAVYPSQGAMTITAADKTSATLTVIDGTRVSVGVDKNGDGSVDETVTTTWSALMARL